MLISKSPYLRHQVQDSFNVFGDKKVDKTETIDELEFNPSKISSYNAIYSVHLHPFDLNRYCSGGADGKIYIWNLKALSNRGKKGGIDPRIRSETKENNENKKGNENQITEIDDMGIIISDESVQDNIILSVLDEHAGTAVNCVRWSPDGRYIASCGNPEVFIWSFAGQSFSSNNQFSDYPERWIRKAICTGHGMDVLDIAWAPETDYLATCSIDNDIIIWKLTNKFFKETYSTLRPFQTLDGHKTHVKGIAWDPIGTFLASSDANGKIIIWQTSDWSKVVDLRACRTPVKKKKKDEPVSYQIPPTTLFQRLSWSPDGKHICISNSTKNGVAVATIFVRRGISKVGTGWNEEVALVGHHQPITVAKFSPVFYERTDQDEKENDNNNDLVIALGGQDCSLSIWVNSNPKPIKVISDLFHSPITDISWFKNGLGLIVSSTDGSTAIVEFEESLIGKPWSDEKQSEWMKKVWGRSFGKVNLSGESIGNNGYLDIIEDTDQLDFENSRLNKNNTINNIATISNISNQNDPMINVLQPRSRLNKDKKRKKKLIAPMVVNSSSSNDLMLPPPKPNNISRLGGSPDRRKRRKLNHHGRDLSFFMPPKSLVSSMPYLLLNANNDEENVISSSKNKKSLLLSIPTKGGGYFIKSSLIKTNPNLENDDETSQTNNNNNNEDEYLDYTRLNCKKTGADDIGINWEIVLPSIVTCLYFIEPKDSIENNDGYIVIGCMDGTLHIFDVESGSRLIAPFVLGSSIQLIGGGMKKESNQVDNIETDKETFLSAITEDGHIHVWELNKMINILTTSLLPAIKSLKMTMNDETNVSKSKIEVMSLSITNDGSPLITIKLVGGPTRAAGFLYNNQLNTWLRIGGGSSYSVTDFYSALKPLQSSSSSSSSSSFNHMKARDVLKQRSNIDDQTKNDLSLSYIEENIASAIAMNSLPQFKVWFKLFIKWLCKFGKIKQLKRICFKGLEGVANDKVLEVMNLDDDDDNDKKVTSINNNNNNNSNSNLLGWYSRESTILGELKINIIKNTIIPVLRENRVYQSLVSEINEILEV